MYRLYRLEFVIICILATRHINFFSLYKLNVLNGRHVYWWGATDDGNNIKITKKVTTTRTRHRNSNYNHSCALLAETCRNPSRVGYSQGVYFFKITGGSDNVFIEEESVIRLAFL